MDQVLDFMGGVPWSLLGTLLVLALLWAWYEVRRGRSDRVENDQAARCVHGRLKYKSCRACAIAFAAEAAPLPAGDAFPRNPPGPAPVASGPPLHDGRPAPAPRPLRIDLPERGAVQLLLSTNAQWPGGQYRVGILCGDRLYDQVVDIPASVSHYRVPFYNDHVQSLILPHVYGLDHVRILVNGNTFVDSHPETLRAALETRRA